MPLSPSDFATIVPYRYITFLLPNGQPDRCLHISVLDYPSDVIFTAAMWVPSGRECDWIFSTFNGHLQLLISANAARPLSRLILVGNAPPSDSYPTSLEALQQDLAPLLAALTPESASFEVPWLVYEDDVIRSFVLEICEGPRAGEMLVENVELVIDGVKEFRRRLRFKRMPNLVQTQMRILPRSDSLDSLEFELEMGVLVQPYLSAMVCGILAVSSSLENRISKGFRQKALCLGVGGGALLSFLTSILNFEVVGVEEDEVVLEVAKKYFGLELNGPMIRLFTEDAIHFIEKQAPSGSEFDVVMVDLDSNDAKVGNSAAPPAEFIRNSVVLSVAELLSPEGVLIINAVPLKESFYETLIGSLREILADVYEVDVGNGENFVLVATKSKVEPSFRSNDGILSGTLKSIVPSFFINSMRKIQ